MTTRKQPRVGLLLLMVAAGASLAGYLLGRYHGEPEHPTRPRAQMQAAAADPWANVWEDDEDEPAAEADPVETEATAAVATPGETGEPLSLGERLDAMRRIENPERSQKMLLGLVADAARRGGAALPELREMLEQGTDIKFASYDGKGPGYPSLRVALLAAAEATGDPAAVALIADVAEQSESPVEVVFSAHLLDRLDSLDAATAQRTFDALGGNLSAEEKKAMAAVVGKVVPAAAKADPQYAEHFIVTQLHITDGTRADPRLIAPALQGLPRERAREIVLDSVMAPDIDLRTKSMLASRAAQRGELQMLSELRVAIESNTLPPRVSASIARSAVSGKVYSSLEKSAYKAVKSGDLEAARAQASRYEARLLEARLTVEAARTAGAKVPAETNKRASIYAERLGKLNHRIYREIKKQEAAAAANAGG